VLPGAVDALERWSASVDLFARLALGLTLVAAFIHFSLNVPTRCSS
jgi:hypothetical protein